MRLLFRRFGSRWVWFVVGLVCGGCGVWWVEGGQHQKQQKDWLFNGSCRWALATRCCPRLSLAFGKLPRLLRGLRLLLFSGTSGCSTAHSLRCVARRRRYAASPTATACARTCVHALLLVLLLSYSMFKGFVSPSSSLVRSFPRFGALTTTVRFSSPGIWQL